MYSPRFFIVAGVALLSGCATAGPGGNQGTSSSNSSAVVCTMEAKLCPDGSAVGRVEPSCEFVPCPGASSSGTALTSATDGTISFSYASGFALATSPDQILVKSYIPSCEAGFSYCMYFHGSAYAGTNFESAGVGIAKRTDLKSKTACLSTQPSGYTDLKPVVLLQTGYATSMFAPLSDAGAGHYAHDRLYRLSVGSSCYEIRQRIGQTQLANYPAGTVREFTAADEESVQSALDSILGSITLKPNRSVTFPVFSGGASSM